MIIIGEVHKVRASIFLLVDQILSLLVSCSGLDMEANLQTRPLLAMVNSLFSCSLVSCVAFSV